MVVASNTVDGPTVLRASVPEPAAAAAAGADVRTGAFLRCGPADPDLLQRIARHSGLEMSQELLFHGSLEDLSGKLRASCDGLVWFAETPIVAQTYIPATGSWIPCRPSDYLERNPDESWAPRTQLDEIAIRQAGFHLQITRNDRWPGSLSYGAADNRFPHYRDFRRLMVDTYGYPPGDEFWRIRTRYVAGQLQIMPHAHRELGTLVIIPRPRELRIQDLTGLGENMCQSYRFTHLFRAALDAGYDGVAIEDLCQTEAWGNVGHTSIGLFPHVVDRLPDLRLPAQHAEALPGGPLSTPEFDQLRQRVGAHLCRRSGP